MSYMCIFIRVPTCTATLHLAFLCAHSLYTRLARCYCRIFKFCLDLTCCRMYLESASHDTCCRERNVEGVDVLLGDSCSGGEKGSMIPSGAA